MISQKEISNFIKNNNHLDIVQRMVQFNLGRNREGLALCLKEIKSHLVATKRLKQAKMNGTIADAKIVICGEKYTKAN